MVVAKVLLQGLVDELVVLSSFPRRPGLGSRRFRGSGSSSRRTSFANGGHDDALDLLLRLEARRLAPVGEALGSFFFRFFLSVSSVGRFERERG